MKNKFPINKNYHKELVKCIIKSAFHLGRLTSVMHTSLYMPKELIINHRETAIHLKNIRKLLLKALPPIK